MSKVGMAMETVTNCKVEVMVALGAYSSGAMHRC